MIEICKDKGVETVYAIMLKTNYKAQGLLQKMGFRIEKIDEETVKGILDLKEEYYYERRATINNLDESFPIQEPQKQPSGESVKAVQESKKKTTALKEQLKQAEQAAAESA
jgi:hypothetical protein